MIPVQKKTWAVELRTRSARDNHISDLAQFNNNKNSDFYVQEYFTSTFVYIEFHMSNLCDK